MSTKKLQIIGNLINKDADTLDGKHASEFASAVDFEALQTQVENIQENAYDDTELKGLISTNANDIDELEALVGDTAVSEQITSAITDYAAPMEHTHDWNSKEGETGYIENRTHYNEILSTQISPTYIWSENVGVYHTDMPVRAVLGIFELSAQPNVYTLGMFGVTYSNCSFGKTYTNTSGPSFNFVIDANYTGTGYEIAVYSSSPSGFYGQTPVLINIGHISKLDEIYIPDTIARVSDVALVGHTHEDVAHAEHTHEWADIEDRPFNDYEGTVNLDETEITVSEDEGSASISMTEPLVSNLNYLILFDGEEYLRSSFVYYGNIILGNKKLSSQGDSGNSDDTPFCITQSTATSAYITVATAGTHTIKVIEITTDRKQLDVKYLPTETEITEVSTDERIPTAKAVYDAIPKDDHINSLIDTSVSEAVSTLETKIAAKSDSDHTHSWNDLGEKTVDVGETLTWDGDMTDRAVIPYDGGVDFVKVSDCILTKADVINGIEFTATDGTDPFSYTISGSDAESMFMEDGSAIIMYGGSFMVLAVVPEEGLYLSYNSQTGVYVNKLTIPGYVFTEPGINPIPEKYLPEVTELVMVSPSGNKFKVTVDDNGNLTATQA